MGRTDFCDHNDQLFYQQQIASQFTISYVVSTRIILLFRLIQLRIVLLFLYFEKSMVDPIITNSRL